MRTGIVGGTFDVLHDGHKALLNTTFREGSHVIIGITSDSKANAARERVVEDYCIRKANVSDFCKTLENIHDASFSISKITNNYQKAIKSDADYIVLSPEAKTHERANSINNEREANGMDRLQIIEAPMVEDYAGRKISSTRIRNNEIDKHGDKQ